MNNTITDTKPIAQPKLTRSDHSLIMKNAGAHLARSERWKLQISPCVSLIFQ